MNSASLCGDIKGLLQNSYDKHFQEAMDGEDTDSEDSQDFADITATFQSKFELLKLVQEVCDIFGYHDIYCVLEKLIKQIK